VDEPQGQVSFVSLFCLYTSLLTPCATGAGGRTSQRVQRRLTWKEDRGGRPLLLHSKSLLLPL
jgi:hypothetical protein